MEPPIPRQSTGSCVSTFHGKFNLQARRNLVYAAWAPPSNIPGPRAADAEGAAAWQEHLGLALERRLAVCRHAKYLCSGGHADAQKDGIVEVLRHHGMPARVEIADGAP
mmetsp:Transcript_12844/g.35946  ORF Transcript_12844/g.35946 Transcript_12844/m.35946 type:complete len:109 (-) Transcript_12844:344-670(-)